MDRPPKPPTLDQWVQDWHDQLELEELSERTRGNYRYNLSRFVKWAKSTNRLWVEQYTSKDMRAYLSHRKRVDAVSDGTRSQEQITLGKWLKWVMEEDPDTLPEHPMNKVPNIKQPKAIKEFLSNDQLTALIYTCHRKTFTDVRDKTMLKVFRDTGVRASELTHALVPHFKLQERRFEVYNGKGGKDRIVRFTEDTEKQLEFYLTVRAEHRLADLPQMWIGHVGALTYAGCYEIFRRRCKQLPEDVHIHPHELRHLFVDNWKVNGGSDDGLMELTGWDDPTMLRHYAAARRQKRALDEYDRVQKNGAKEE